MSTLQNVRRSQMSPYGTSTDIYTFYVLMSHPAYTVQIILEKQTGHSLLTLRALTKKFTFSAT